MTCDSRYCYSGRAGSSWHAGRANTKWLPYRDGADLGFPALQIQYDDYKILNKEGLRNNKEFVNHKILDLAGDFLLSGHRVIGKIKCYQGGHQLTNIFLRKLFKEKSSTKLIELENIFISNKNNTDQTRKIAVNA